MSIKPNKDKLKKKSTIAVFGSGAREHSICWKLSQSEQVKQIYVIPGNVGTLRVPNTQNVTEKTVMFDDNDKIDIEKLIDWLRKQEIYLVVINSETLLHDEIAKELKDAGICLCFGSTRSSASTGKDWSKSSIKKLLKKKDVPSARFKIFDKKEAEKAKKFIRNNPDSFRGFVVKAGRLNGHKKVVSVNAEHKEKACTFVDDLADKSPEDKEAIIVEELLEGEEVTVMAFTDGGHIEMMLPVQGYKSCADESAIVSREMAAFAPFKLTTQEKLIIEAIIQKIQKLSKNTYAYDPFTGVISVGLMITVEGIYVIGIKCRFVDCQTQVLMPLLENDLFTVMEACCDGKLKAECKLKWKEGVVSAGYLLAVTGYPKNETAAISIRGRIEIPINPGPGTTNIFYEASTYIAPTNEEIQMREGRVLFVVAEERLLISANKRVLVSFEQNNIIPEAHKNCENVFHKWIAREIVMRPESQFIRPESQLIQADVETSRTNNMIENLKKRIKVTHTDSAQMLTILPHLGSFGASIELIQEKYKNPVFVTNTGSVAMKLKLAQQYGKHDAIGQDLVAMCANNILTQGAKPLFFLGYYACGKLDPETAKNNIITQVLPGVIEGCTKSKCALVGENLAVMPGLYETNEYDLSGYVVGVVEREFRLPKSDKIKKGDVVVYLPSNGLHLDGFNVIHKIIQNRFVSVDNAAPFNLKKTYRDEFFKPMENYVTRFQKLNKNNKLKAFVCISSEGLIDCISRIIPSQFKAVLNAANWDILPVFRWIAGLGCISTSEMLRTFNCGIGAIMICDSTVVSSFHKDVEEAKVIGILEDRKKEEPPVIVNGFEDALLKGTNNNYLKDIILRRATRKHKRVAVLLSGTDTNLKSLINDTIYDPLSPVQIVYVISNDKNAVGLKIAEEYNIPIHVTSHAEPDENVIMNLLNDWEIDVVCVTSFPINVGPAFLKRYRNDSIMFYPSLFPPFDVKKKPKDIHEDVIERNNKYSGCTVYFIEDEKRFDMYIIEQAVVKIEKKDDASSLAKKIEIQGYDILPRALRMVAEEMIRFNVVGRGRKLSFSSR